MGSVAHGLRLVRVGPGQPRNNVVPSIKKKTRMAILLLSFSRKKDFGEKYSTPTIHSGKENSVGLHQKIPSLETSASASISGFECN
jgi:hypothetical protein